MARINPNAMMLDGGGEVRTGMTSTGVAPTAADKAGKDKALADAAIAAKAEADAKAALPMTPYSELTAEERAAMSAGEKTAYIKAAREEKMAKEAADRAASDPMKNFAERPEAPEPAPGMINYYSWIGGTTTGNWKLYQAVDTPENRQKYGGRAIGGATEADNTGSAADANTLIDTPVFDTATNTWTPKGEVTEEPVVEEPVIEEPVVKEPVVKEPVIQEPKITEPAITEPAGAVVKTPEQIETERQAAENKAGRQSAYDLLYSEFRIYGLESLITPLRDLIEQGISPSEFALKLRDDPLYNQAYKKRFAANEQRIAKGLRALSEAEYIATEDQYQDVMRRYGLPETYYKKGDLGVQTGFEKFLAGDVSAVELEDRIQTAQKRVTESNPEVVKALRQFYPGISNGDILAYVLNPTNAIEDIKRKVTAAEIGGAAMQSGLNLGQTPEEIARYAARAAELGAAGVTKQQAQAGFQTVAEVTPRAGQLADIYKQGPYTQTTAEKEIFGLTGATEAAKQRKKLTSLETAQFSGQAGAGAIARERAGDI